MAILAAISASGIVVLIGASVSMRYFTFTPFSFTEELVGLLMTASFFFSASPGDASLRACSNNSLYLNLSQKISTASNKIL
jgi:hypothetical protein